MAAAAFSESKVIAAKAMKNKTGCKDLRKFLGIPERPRSPTALLISKFIRLNNHQSPGIKDRNWDENLKTLLQGKKRVGVPEITRLLSPEFTYSRIKSTDSLSSSVAEKKQLYSTNKSKKTKKAKAKEKKKTSSKKTK